MLENKLQFRSWWSCFYHQNESQIRSETFSITVSTVGALSQEPNILHIIAGMIGSRRREVTSFHTWDLLIPFITYSNLGNKGWVKGSAKPSEIWFLRCTILWTGASIPGHTGEQQSNKRPAQREERAGLCWKCCRRLYALWVKASIPLLKRSRTELSNAWMTIEESAPAGLPWLQVWW